MRRQFLNLKGGPNEMTLNKEAICFLDDDRHQGCQIALGATYQNGKKYTK
jgi:hypothetical protein